MKVIYSPGFGSGLSTWNNNIKANDPDIISLFEKKATADEVSSIFGNSFINEIAWRNCVVVDVPEGMWYRIKEYDGSESIEIIDPENLQEYYEFSEW
jgi:hypothetical protein